MQSRRPSPLARWWLPLSVLALAVVLVGAKLSIRSVATGQPVLPGVAGAPVLGPAPSVSPTPLPSRVPLRVHVTDQAGQPASQALVEVRDRFNTAVGAQETGVTGDAFLQVPPNPAYVVTVRKAGFGQGRVEGIAVDPLPAPTAGPTATPNLAGAGQQGVPGDRPTGLGPPGGRFANAKQIEVQLGAAEAPGAAPGIANAVSNLARLYVGHSTPRISLVDATSDLLLKHSDTLGQGRQTFFAANSDRSRLFASWSGSQDVLILDAAELTVQGKTNLGGAGITSLAVNPQNGRLWVSTTTETSDVGVLNEMDDSAQQVLRRVPVGNAVFGMRFRPDGSSLFVPQRTSSTLTFFDPTAGQITGAMRMSQWPTDFSLSPDGQSLYVVNIGADKLLEVGATNGEVRRSLDIGNGANAIALLPNGQRAFVLNQLLGYVQVIDLPGWQIADLIPVGRAPQGLALSPDGATLFVANAGSGSISVVDVEKRTVRDTLNIGGAPSSLLLLKN